MTRNRASPAAEGGAVAPAQAPSLVTQVGGTRAGIVVFGGIGALNAGNAAFHLLAARVLGPSSYSEVVSLVAVSGLVAIPFGGLQIAVARYVATDAERGRAGAVAAFVRWSLVVCTVAGAIATFVLLVCSPLIKSALGVDTLAPVVITALYLLPAVIAPAAWGVAQGLQRFGILSGSLAAGAAVRIVLVLALLPFGLTVAGAMGATLVGGIAALVVPAPLIRRWLRTPRDRVRSVQTREFLRYLTPVVVGTLAVTSLTTVDLIVARVALSEHDAGIYGSASFIGRLILYLPATIATVLLPKVASRAAAERDTTGILYASVAVTAGLSLAATLILAGVPTLVVDVSFGTTFDPAAGLLWIFALAMTTYAILNVQLVYHLGRGDARMAVLLVGGALAQVVAFALVHGSTYQLVGVSLATGAVLLLLHELWIDRTLVGTAHWLAVRFRDSRSR